MDKTSILANKKYGIIVHYLHGIQNGKYSPTNPTGVTTSWDQCVKDFDVEAFAKNVKRCGAGYVMFTLCQVSPYICAPSSTFDEITEGKCKGGCTERDLPLELGKALEKYGIDLYLYFTGDGPRGDAVSSKAFGTLAETDGNVTEPFVRKWAAVMEELAVRYGKLVKGWWIDGCFDYIGYNDDLLKIYKDAALAGNPEALVTFNNGVVRLDMTDPEVIALSDGEIKMDKAIDVINTKALDGNETAKSLILKYDTPKKYRYSAYEDYTAGEATYFNEIPKTSKVDGSLWHVMSFLGISRCMPLCGILCGWAGPGSRYSSEYVKEYTNKVNAVGGVVTFDVCVDRFGAIDEGQVAVLSNINK